MGRTHIMDPGWPDIPQPLKILPNGKLDVSRSVRYGLYHLGPLREYLDASEETVNATPSFDTHVVPSNI